MSSKLALSCKTWPLTTVTFVGWKLRRTKSFPLFQISACFPLISGLSGNARSALVLLRPSTVLSSLTGKSSPVLTRSSIAGLYRTPTTVWSSLSSSSSLSLANRTVFSSSSSSSVFSACGADAGAAFSGAAGGLSFSRFSPAGADCAFSAGAFFSGPPSAGAAGAFPRSFAAAFCTREAAAPDFSASAALRYSSACSLHRFRASSSAAASVERQGARTGELSSSA